MSYQPVEHGVACGWQIRPLLPSGGSDRYTSAPVRESACRAMSGTPRWPAGIGVLPGGRTAWKAGRANTWLKPPPVATPPAGRSQTISAWPAAAGAWQPAGGSTLSTVRVTVLLGSVQRLVPPTAVTSGSDAGHPTVGNGIVEPPLPTGDFLSLTEPVSPDEASTVTPFCAAEMNAWRRFCSDCELPNASSAEPKLCEITSAR